MPQWVYPLDPDCPEVIRMHSVMGSPIYRVTCDGTGTQTEEYVMANEIMEDFERTHRPKCPRCQEYGVANVEVDS